MRKPEKQMIDRIINGNAGICGNNTFVDFMPVSGAIGNNLDVTCAIVTLYNTEIDRLFINNKTGEILSHSFDHGGYRTATTKSRLNALAQFFRLEKIVQKGCVWYRNNKPF